MYKCKICDRSNIKNLLGFSTHVKWKHNLNIIEYYIKYENFEIPKCRFCDENAKPDKGLIFRKTCGRYECKCKNSELLIHSSETKNKISKAVLNNFKNHPEKYAWFRRSKNNISYIEKLFINLIKEENLENKYDIIKEYPVYPYFIDFAFENIKVAIELDGNQHLNNDRILSDKNKDDLLFQNGWRTLRISSYDIKNDYNNVKCKVLNFINNSEILYEKIYDNMLSYIELKKIKNEKIEKQKQLKKIKREEYLNNQKQILLNILNENDINRGIITKISKDMNISHTQVKRLIKKFNIII